MSARAVLIGATGQGRRHRLVTVQGGPPGQVRSDRGIDALLCRSARTRSLPSELGVAWAEASRTYA